MKQWRYHPNFHQKLVTACLLCCLLASCTVVGPSAVRSGRLAYNEAIIETDNQQMLMAIIKNRYEESANLLAVASVTANVSITTRSGIQLGLGDNDNFTGNLVPFSAGAIYEENPTISYIPVAGAKYARQVFSPIPLSVLAQLTGRLTDTAHIYYALISSVNGIQNPDFQFAQTKPDPRFSRFVTIMSTLTQAQELHWIQDQRQAGSLSIVIDRYAQTHADEVDELLDLLGMPAVKDRSAQLILPVSLALDGHDSGGVGISTRSVGDLVEILTAAVEIPEDDQRKGIAKTYPPAGLAGKALRVRHSRTRPEQATVAVQHRDDWFYIGETNLATKQYFKLMQALWSVAIADTTQQGTAAPVLTVPVSR